MKRLPVLFAVLFMVSIPLLASEAPPVEPPGPVADATSTTAPEAPLLGTPEPLFASYCRAVAMTSCDNGTWLVCEGQVQCDFGWKWVYCDGQTWVCPECSWGASCL